MSDRPQIVIQYSPKNRVSEGYLYSYQNSRCFYCNCFMFYGKHNHYHRPNGYTIDHVFPASLGFSREGNMVLACRDCNLSKADRLPTHNEIDNACRLYAIMGRDFIATIKNKG